MRPCEYAWPARAALFSRNASRKSRCSARPSICIATLFRLELASTKLPAAQKAASLLLDTIFPNDDFNCSDFGPPPSEYAVVSAGRDDRVLVGWRHVELGSVGNNCRAAEIDTRRPNRQLAVLYEIGSFTAGFLAGLFRHWPVLRHIIRVAGRVAP